MTEFIQRHFQIIVNK